jgi:uncharacterized membrane protein YphA (DoxX/SURF4 family)
METTIKKYGLIPLSTKNRRLITDVISYLFVLLFVYTAAGKLMTLDTFKSVLTHYPIIGAYSTVIAYVVPFLEISISMMLIYPPLSRLGLVASLLLMMLFLAYIIYMIASGSDLPCSCGGLISKLSWQNHIWFNSIFILLAGLGITLSKL